MSRVRNIRGVQPIEDIGRTVSGLTCGNDCKVSRRWRSSCRTNGVRGVELGGFHAGMRDLQVPDIAFNPTVAYRQDDCRRQTKLCRDKVTFLILWLS